MLYGLRWGIETSFRELKHVLGVKNFHAKEREYIEMEIWARLILYNFCSIITAHVVIEQKDKERKHAYQVNYTIAYQACHYFLGLPDGQIKYLQVLKIKIRQMGTNMVIIYCGKN